MGNSPRARAQRKALVVTVQASELPPGFHKIVSAYTLWINPPFSLSDLRSLFYREQYEFAPTIAAKMHGSFNAYNNWYCRCPLCTWANTAKVRERREDAGQDSDAEDE